MIEALMVLAGTLATLAILKSEGRRNLARYLSPSPSQPVAADGLDRLAARYVRGEIDLLDYLFAVDDYDPAAPAQGFPLNPHTRAALAQRCQHPLCDGCEKIVTDGTGWSAYICVGDCGLRVSGERR